MKTLKLKTTSQEETLFEVIGDSKTLVEAIVNSNLTQSQQIPIINKITENIEQIEDIVKRDEFGFVGDFVMLDEKYTVWILPKTA